VSRATHIQSLAGDHKITAPEKLVLLLLANNSNSEGKCAFCSLRRIASDSCLTFRGVIKIIQRLEKLCALGVHRVPGHSRSEQNSYTLNLRIFRLWKSEVVRGTVFTSRGEPDSPHEVNGVHPIPLEQYYLLKEAGRPTDRGVENSRVPDTKKRVKPDGQPPAPEGPKKSAHKNTPPRGKARLVTADSASTSEEQAAVMSLLLEYIPLVDAPAPGELLEICRTVNAAVTVGEVCTEIRALLGQPGARAAGSPVGWLKRMLPRSCRPKAIEARRLARAAQAKVERDRPQ